MKIAVLMTVHNRKDATLQCLDHLHGQALPSGCSLDVYLTDDGCTDGTPQAVAAAYPDVHIVHGDGSLFWNRGMISSWQAAVADDSHDCFLWLNDDTYLYPDALTRLIDLYDQKGKECIVVGETSSSSDSGVITYGGRRRDCSLITADSRPERCDTFNGNVVLIPDSVYRHIGMLDSRFRHSLGDFDYGLRATAAGIECLVMPGACGVCDEHASLTAWRDPDVPLPRRWRNFVSPLGANPFEFFRYKRRHYGLPWACATFVSNFIHLLIPGLWRR